MPEYRPNFKIIYLNAFSDVNIITFLKYDCYLKYRVEHDI